MSLCVSPFYLLLFLRTSESFAKFIVFLLGLRFICEASIEEPSCIWLRWLPSLTPMALLCVSWSESYLNIPPAVILEAREF